MSITSKIMKRVLKKIPITSKNSGVIVHLTDTYFLKESKIGKKIDLPGFGRIYKILEFLSKNFTHEKILFLHSGDFLFPSFLSNFFKGKQMVDVLNQCGLNYCTLGNHDFDGGPKILKKRINESKFNYIITNLQSPKNFSKNISQYDVWPKKSPEVAIVGISGKMTMAKAIENGFQTKNLRNSLKDTLLEIKQKFPDIKLLVALSHMGDAEDLQFKKTLNNLWSHNSIILGGHDHNQIISYNKKSEKCMLVKGQSNARTLQIILLNKKIIQQKNADLQKNLIVLDSKDYAQITSSTKLEKKIGFWFKKLKIQNRLPPNRIVKKFSKGVILDATEVSLRKGTTNFGNFITDCLKNYTNADIAMINSGHFRSDRLFSEKLSVLDLFTTFVMEERGNIMVTKLTKKECMLFLRHSYSDVGKGKILQISKNTLSILNKAKNNDKFNVALISDMLYSNEDGFGKILAEKRNISITKLRKLITKDIVRNTSLIDGIMKTASQVRYDSKIRARALPKTKYNW